MRAAFLAAMCAITLASPAFADEKKDKPKSNQLTPKEIAAGYVMLFDNETLFGWAIEGEATVKDGWMVLGGTKATTATCSTALPTNTAIFELDYEKNLPGEKQPRVALTAKLKDVFAPPGALAGAATNDELTRVTITVPAGTVARVGRVNVKPTSNTKLFDGKNLDGWKVNAADPKRMMSKFEVTKDGELSLKNGPGDLVTEKEFDNFVLQAECKTLGDGLNSGFFFRCIPGQYQNGYEAQIQNSFLDKDRSKPKDFGTGAIYRRIAARKVVTNDNEWFTMTVVADGKHIATWVNGYQTVDWTDDRKENDNPRQGYRAGKGPISIQGHDPTTDLLFRNIRIAELPGEKK
ncbi:MAG: DUF1080 domain-containing protein [Planctomycetes bacterium]|nr:DUF1080 domain-containing protein [Planctomycetota bacterium]